MPNRSSRPHANLPEALSAQVAQADHLSRALGFLSAQASKRELADLWLLGRSDEVRTLVDEILSEWSDGAIDTGYACEAIGSYVGSLHIALHRRYGGNGASCCGPHLEPFAGPSIRGASLRAVRAPLESGLQSLTSTGELSADTAPSTARAPKAERKSAG